MSGPPQQTPEAQESGVQARVVIAALVIISTIVTLLVLGAIAINNVPGQRAHAVQHHVARFGIVGRNRAGVLLRAGELRVCEQAGPSNQRAADFRLPS